MGIGFKELIVVLLIVILIFGAGKIPSAMRDVGRSLKSFCKGMKEGDSDDCT